MDLMLILRVTNIVVSLLVLGLLSHSAYSQWKSWNQKTKTHWWALVGWVFLGLEMTIENLFQENSPGPKTIIQTLVLAWTIRALTSQGSLSAQTSAFWKRDEKDE